MLLLQCKNTFSDIFVIIEMQWNVNVELENRWNHLKKKERETDIKRLLNFNYITFMRYGDCFFLSSYSKFKDQIINTTFHTINHRLISISWNNSKNRCNGKCVRSYRRNLVERYTYVCRYVYLQWNGIKQQHVSAVWKNHKRVSLVIKKSNFRVYKCSI